MSNVYLVLEVTGTFTKGSRDTPGPLDGVFDSCLPLAGLPAMER